MANLRPMPRALLLPLVCLVVGCGGGQATSSEQVIVFAAASTQGPVQALANAFRERRGRALRVSFGASSTLARQIQQGARADLFLTAHPRYLDALEGSRAGPPRQRRTLARNRLVLAAPRGSRLVVRAERGFPIAEAFEGPLVTGDPAHVPLGLHARAALQQLGWWQPLAGRIAGALDARGALALLASGSAQAGILYASDANQSDRVRVVCVLPVSGAGPLIEGALLGPKRRPPAREFLEFVASPQGRAVWRSFGFQAGPPASAPAPTRVAERESRVSTSPWQAVLLSLQVACMATLVTLIPGVLLAWLLARRSFRGKLLLESLVTLPLVLPPVVVGYALLGSLAPASPLGAYLQRTLGLRLAFDWKGAALAAGVMGLPLLVRSARIAFESVDARLEACARSLGAGSLRAFVTVTLPLALPGVAAGSLLAFARSLGEFGATITFVGNLEGSTQTLPLRIFTLAQGQEGASVVWPSVLCSLALSIMAVAGGELLNRRLAARVAH